jgi:hypothetical protein
MESSVIVALILNKAMIALELDVAKLKDKPGLKLKDKPGL